jgi:UDP-N-acetylmuramate dehydrogenase
MKNSHIASEHIIIRLKKFGRVEQNIPMKNFTTFKTGGIADILFYPGSYEQTADAIKLLHDEQVPYYVTGGGSNLVIGDEGIRGVVIKIDNERKIENPVYITESGLIFCDAGVSKSDFIQFALQNGFGGIEFMVGVPGCMGGGIIMNAGTYMGTFSDILKSIVYVTYKGELREENLNSQESQYRDMGLSKECAVILGGYYSLPKVDDIDSVKNRVNEIHADRKMKHPIEYPSAGSVFKNPPGHSSWKLVNDSGLKGYTIGGAQVSEKHTNFIINKDNATSAEIRALVEYVRHTVLEKYNVELHTEIKMVGEFH